MLVRTVIMTKTSDNQCYVGGKGSLIHCQYEGKFNKIYPEDMAMEQAQALGHGISKSS